VRACVRACVCVCDTFLEYKLLSEFLHGVPISWTMKIEEK